jgi:CheY-like chemotaxis protein
MFFKRGATPQESDRDVQRVSHDLHCRLLLVEDNDAVAQVTRELLESMGCTVQRVDGGQAALQHVDAHASEFDVVLSDIEMPGEIDGIALASLLLHREPPMPIVLMTGYAVRMEQAVRQRLEVLPKPCSPAMLAEAIGKALARSQALPLPAADQPVNAAGK